MSKNIENNNVAKEFWENLADATALETGTKTALRSKIGAATTAEANDYADAQLLSWAVWTTDWHDIGADAIAQVTAQIMDHTGATRIHIEMPGGVLFTFPVTTLPVPNQVKRLSVSGYFGVLPFYPEFTSDTLIEFIEILGDDMQVGGGGEPIYRDAFLHWLEMLSSVVNSGDGELLITQDEDPAWSNEELSAINDAIQPLLALGWGVQLPGLQMPFPVNEWEVGDNTADNNAVVTRGELVADVYTPTVDGSLWIQRDNFNAYRLLEEVWPAVSNDLGGSILPPFDAYTDRTIFAGVGYYKIA